jgi:hypothetical protein
MPPAGQRGGQMTTDKARDTGDQYCRHYADLIGSSHWDSASQSGNSSNAQSLLFFAFMPNPVYTFNIDT